MSRLAVIGDTQNISLDFPEAKAGEVWKVQVNIEKPNGEILAHYVSYKFIEPKETKADE